MASTKLHFWGHWPRAFSTLARGLVLAAPILFAIGQGGDAGAVGDQVGTAQDVVGDVYGNNLNQRMTAGDLLHFGQRVRTGERSAVDLTFMDDTQILLGARTEIVIDTFAYDAANKAVTWDMQAVNGVLRFISGGAKMDVSIETRFANIGIRGTTFDLKASARETEIAVHEGVVAVTGKDGEALVRAGEIYAVGSDGRGEVRTAMSTEMNDAIQGMLGFLNRMDDFGVDGQGASAPAGQMAETAQAMSAQANWIEALGDTDPADAMVFDTRYGPVVIELLPALAPAHTERMRRLAQHGFYDGKSFYSVRPGFAVEAGDLENNGADGMAVPLPAEFSNTPFLRGTVGMIHPAGDINGATSRFFITLSPQPHLDGKYTVWGRVIYGMETLDKLKPGDPPTNPDIILKLRVVEDDAG